MRVSVVILPVFDWTHGREVWARAEAMGFWAAYTYDHLSWRTFRDGPWYAALPTLTAAATVTSRVRLGTMVTSPNYRHPVTLAKELMTLDDVSGGRVTLGVGAGTTGLDASVLGQPALSPVQRAERFEEFLVLLDELLRTPMTSWTGAHFAAHEAAMHPGTVQQPRIPFAIAAGGPRGRRLVAAYGRSWVSTGLGDDDADEPARLAHVRDGLDRVRDACVELGRDPAEVGAVLLTGFTGDRPLASLQAFLATAAAYASAGVEELVLHWPLPDTQFAADAAVWERIATEGVPAVADLRPGG